MQKQKRRGDPHGGSGFPCNESIEFARDHIKRSKLGFGWNVNRKYKW